MSNYSPLRWGILGCGSIANRLGNDVVKLGDHRLQAIASRDAGKAERYAQKFGVPTRHTGDGAYEALVNDPEVDLVYIATPHNFHKAQSLMAIAAGKAVLCEKPFTVTLAEAQEVIQAAKAANVFLMEGMWSRCFPAMHKVRELLAGGAIGKPRMMYADFGYRAGSLGDDNRLTGYNADGRLFNPALAGGGLMDVGVYPVSLSQMVFGDPSEIKAVGILGHSGVDENVGIVLGFPGGEIALASTSIQVTTPFATTILGTDGKIEIDSPWWCPKSVTLSRGDQQEKFAYSHEGEGFQFEAMEVAACLRAGKTESEVVPHADTLAVMKALDTIRKEIGLRFPIG